MGMRSNTHVYYVVTVMYVCFSCPVGVAVSIKEDTAYPCLHSPNTTKERRSIRRIQKKSIRRIEDIVCEYSGRYQTWSLLQETLIRRIQPIGYAGLPPNVYAIVNHHKVAKEICDRVKLLMQGTRLSLKERECKLYDEFDKFSFVKGETMYHLTVLVFTQGDDLIACFNKAMAFLSAVAASRVTVQQVQGWQGQSYAGTGYMGNATSSGGNNTGGQARVVKCYNYQGEGHMARQCTQSKRLRNAT
ncbi:retrovirus-related pol polyprotein from transposon TNT 1-94 [Tanacetum coccineum]